ncbi:uncharacterized protein LOC127842547 isoform X3 [Dreissena polymorpha]|uniref:uncharacterized protein LOC127842547 isoform X3 n=1 Tax=Dreissena polymorpha TaxID=45954 RepID=UPI0022648DB5|nr:uncharacterized protein LOC127842547 isoform X3 [Dreissena polymorpha]
MAINVLLALCLLPGTWAASGGSGHNVTRAPSHGGATTSAHVATSSGPRCHQCTGATDPHYCSMVVQCNPDEECHTEKVIGDNSIVYYNAGCQKTQLCKLAAHGRRGALSVCEGCCSTDLCNTELCPASNSTKPGVQCYQCDSVDSPEDCTNRVTCADGEQCIVQKYAADSFEIKYNLGCETKQRCDLLNQLGKRSTQLCNECCDTPGCNRHLCIQANATSTCQNDPELDCKLADDAHSICAEHTLAATKYCRKYCGYCTDGTGTTMTPPIGSTHDPCRDSGDIDCKQMNDTLRMCEKKMSPPTLLYCPKFCGLCTPSTGPSSTCADSQEMDCKLANDSMHICLHHTPIAVKHCSMFCGYCTTDGSPVTTLPTPTGATEDPCQDNPTIDCATMNATLGICAQNDSLPTQMYCPKYCGICKPACADSPDVDCRKANDTQNICALGTLSARQYCRKFCGYCGGPGVITVVPPSAATCVDHVSYDCRTMDDQLHICVYKDNPATTTYCPKYCGLC